MDIVLIPQHSTPDRHLFTERGLGQLVRMNAWLTAQGSQADHYLVVPRGRPDLIPLLAEFAPVLRPAGKLFFVLALQDLSLAALETAVACGVAELVIHADESHAFDATGQSALTSFLRSPHAWRCCIQLWMPTTHDGQELARATRFAACGLGIDAIREPAFPLEPAASVPLTGKAPPRELTDAMPSCQFFSNSLTLDASAGIQACARHAPDDRLGSFLDENPDALLYRKGYSTRRLQATPICRSCFYAARFTWPKPTPETIDTLLRTGMDAGPETAEEA